jgi:outer membrane protein assembly factor BamB
VVDVDLLPGGRLLVAEGSAYQVTERDRQGKVLWSHKTDGYATTVKRLPNGNVFFSGYGEMAEVTREGKVVFSYKSPFGTIYRVQRLRNGNLLFATTGRVMEIDRTGKQVRNVVIPGGTGIWAHVELLPNGHYLVAQYSANKVIELDADGKVHWQVTVTTPSSASRLPNGNILVSSMDARLVVEFNRAGKEVWKQATQGRPFLVRRY